MKNKKLKKYIQKQIQKQVSADFAGFDNRVYECEKTLGLTENSLSKEIFKSMMAEFNQRPFSWIKVAESENEKIEEEMSVKFDPKKHASFEKALLSAMFSRLVLHGENPTEDFMINFKEIIEKMN